MRFTAETASGDVLASRPRSVAAFERRGQLCPSRRVSSKGVLREVAGVLGATARRFLDELTGLEATAIGDGSHGQ